MEYIPNCGQTYMPFQKNIHVPTLDYTPAPLPSPAYPELELNEEAKEKGWIITSQCQHFLPGVTEEMLDWWWVNMEKGYYLWAPGSHKRFNWVRAPWEHGFLNSAHMISEAMVPGKPVFGGSGIQINRLPLSYFPFTTHFSHVIVEGIFNAKDEFVDATIHMWQAAPGGVDHMTASVANTRCTMPPAFVLEDPTSAPTDEARAIHAEYEISRWPVFLPTLFGLWQGHPDPSQNVQCNLEITETVSGLSYTHKNGPVTVE